MKNKHNEKLEVVVAKNAGLSFAGSVISISAKIGIGILITRTLGPSSYGIYALSIVLLIFFETISLHGFQYSIVKHVSQYSALEDSARLRGTIIWGIGYTQILGALCCIIVLVISPYISINIFSKPDLLFTLKLIVIALPFRCLCRINIASLQGLKLIKYGVYTEQIIVPFTRLMFVAIIAITNIGLAGIIFSFVLSTIIGAIFSLYCLLKNVPNLIWFSSAKIEYRKLTLFSLPLFISALFRIIMARSDTLIVGYFLSSEFLGIYAIAKRIAPLIAFPLNAFNSIFAPIISDLYAKKRMDELQRQFKIVARWIISVSLPIFAFMVVFSKPIMSVFGHQFIAGYTVLIILSIGQLLNTATGSVGFMLIMTGKPLANTINSSILCITSIFLNIFLVPVFGIIGAAYTSMLSILLVQLLRISEVWYFLRIHPYRIDFLKPILSAIAAIMIISIFALSIDRNILGVFWLPASFSIYIIIYACFLLLFKLSHEDHVVIDFLKQRILRTSG
jgi:O-antigen/teichoic acid export membrane protein